MSYLSSMSHCDEFATLLFFIVILVFGDLTCLSEGQKTFGAHDLLFIIFLFFFTAYFLYNRSSHISLSYRGRQHCWCEVVTIRSVLLQDYAVLSFHSCPRDHVIANTFKNCVYKDVGERRSTWSKTHYGFVQLFASCVLDFFKI